MTNNVDLVAITRSLSSILTSLTELTSHANQTTLQPARTSTIVKTQEMTYHDFLGRILSTITPHIPANSNQPYRLQEDLQILFDLSSYKEINNKAFAELVAGKKVNRSLQSLKERYKVHLSKIAEPEMQTIISWVEREGVKGYLYFENKQLKITINDPSIPIGDKVKEEWKRKRPASLERSEAKEEEISNKKRSGPKVIVPTNCKQLNEVIKFYSKMVNIPIKTLLEWLDQVSGDFVELDNYIETKDSRILWSPAQDEILRKGGPQVEFLRKFRGSKVEARIQYLNLK